MHRPTERGDAFTDCHEYCKEQEYPFGCRNYRDHFLALGGEWERKEVALGFVLMLPMRYAYNVSMSPALMQWPANDIIMTRGARHSFFGGTCFLALARIYACARTGRI